MIVLAILVAASVLFSNIVRFSGFVDTSLENSLERALTEIKNEINVLDDSVAHIAALFFSSDSEMINAMDTEDRNALLDRSMYLYNKTSVEMFVVTDKTGRVIARPHAPEFQKYYLTFMRSVRSALLGTPVTTIEGGAAVNLMVCSSAPILNEHSEVLGVVLVGFRLDTNEFVDKHKQITGCEIAVFRGSEIVATTLQNEDGSRALNLIAPPYISEAVLAGVTVSGSDEILGHNMLVIYAPITDGDGNAIGMLFAGHFLDEKDATVQTFVTAGIIITAILLAVSVPIILFVSGRITNPINKRLDQVYYDALTGIYNRRYLDETLKQTIQTLSRSKGSLSLLMIDIDFFKKYNDTYGHGEGDKCLKMIADALAKATPRADDFVARYGGEEFVVVLPNSDEEAARFVANKLIESVENCNIPHEGSDIAAHVTVSVGATTSIAEHTQKGDDYIKRADEMLYKSKQGGRNRYSFEELDERRYINDR